ncbi:MAG: hypothetical protein AMXMBFR58_30060 [Phycisphaerae bacterium]
MGPRRLLRLELDLAHPPREGDVAGPVDPTDPLSGARANDIGPAVLLWPRSPIQPPEVPDAIVVSVDGDLVRLRPPGARLSEVASVGEWLVIRGSHVRVTWGTSVHESGILDPGEQVRAAGGVPHIEIDARGPVRCVALPTIPGTRLMIGSRSAGADIAIEDSIAQRVVCRITFDGRDYRVDSQDPNAMIRLNGSEIFWPATLAPGDQITIGLANVRFLTTVPTAALETAPPPAQQTPASESPRRPKRKSVLFSTAWVKVSMAAAAIVAVLAIILMLLYAAANLL